MPEPGPDLGQLAHGRQRPDAHQGGDGRRQARGRHPPHRAGDRRHRRAPTVAELLDRIKAEATATFEAGSHDNVCGRFHAHSGPFSTARGDVGGDVDLTWSTRGGVPGRGGAGWRPTWPRGAEDGGGAIALGDTREGFAEHLEWERRLFDDRWAVVSWPASTAGGASLWEWLIFEEEYYRAGAPPGSRRTASSCWRRRCSSSAPPSSRTASSADGRGDDLVVPGLVGAERRQRPGRHPGEAAARRAADVLDGQKTWTTRGAFCTDLFGLFRTDPESERHKGLTYLLVPLDAGRDGAGLRAARRRRGLRRGLLRRRFLADDAVGVVLGERGPGLGRSRWRPPAPSAGLTLRSPGRFLATAARLVELYRGARRRRRPALRDAVAEAWMRPRPTSSTPRTVTRLLGGAIGAAPRSASTRSVVVRARRALHEIALDLLGPEAERSTAPWLEGLPVLAVGPDLRRHQRDPAQHHRRARARPAEDER